MSRLSTAFRLLPGPLGVRIVEAAILVAAFLIALHFFYSWLGNVMLDQGGTIG